MWPGVLTASSREFKANVTGVVYAHKALVIRYISTLQEDRSEPTTEDNDADTSEEDDQAAKEHEESKAQKPRQR